MCDYCRVLQDSAQESGIMRDIHRTFPAHDYFKDSDGDGQDSLYKICKVRPTLFQTPSSLWWYESTVCDFVEQKVYVDAHAVMLCLRILTHMPGVCREMRY